MSEEREDSGGVVDVGCYRTIVSMIGGEHCTRSAKEVANGSGELAVTIAGSDTKGSFMIVECRS